LKQVIATVISNAEIMSGVNLMWLGAPDIAATAQPGQFITVRCEDFVLRRPFSIHQVSPSQVAILFKAVGKGTLWLSRRQAGDKLDVLGPLGNGFSIPSVIARRPEQRRGNSLRQSRNLLLLAGGIGMAPLRFLAQHACSRHSITLIQGASTAARSLILNPSPFKGEGRGECGKQSSLSSLSSEIRLVSVTEDGSAGRKGMITDILPDFLDWADRVYACGPLSMYKAMAELNCHSEEAERPKNLAQDGSCWESKLKKCQISLEVRIGCGIGACYGCTINTKKGLRKVCRDGPVFELDDILWEEVRI
jgi:dihydroorotate dehydrogenase electron transfer subunit